MFWAGRKTNALKAASRLTVRNDSETRLDVWVELNPDLYWLEPGQEMQIDANLRGGEFHVTIGNGSVQVYPGNDCAPPVTIDGTHVKPA